jgi:hypothetical protein
MNATLHGPPSRWPKLSETLPGPAAPDRCQACQPSFFPQDPGPLERWVECDEHDQPTDVVVVLCSPCARKLIEPHPRLYRPLGPNDPHPGAMGICVDCVHRTGTRCSRTRANGGPGIRVTIARPTVAHLNYGGGRGAFKKLYASPASDCSRREVRQGGAP